MEIKRLPVLEDRLTRLAIIKVTTTRIVLQLMSIQISLTLEIYITNVALETARAMHLLQMRHPMLVMVHFFTLATLVIAVSPLSVAVFGQVLD